MTWEVAPARLSDGSVVDLWRGTEAVSWAVPTPAARTRRFGRWRSFAIDKPWGGESTVKMQYLLILLVLIPILTVIAIQQCFVRSMHDFHHFFLALFVGHAYNYSMCETLKVAGGRLRPDFIARMKMNGGWNDMSNSDVLDGHLSWPSGHSSMAAIGATVFQTNYSGGFDACLSVTDAYARDGGFLAPRCS